MSETDKPKHYPNAAILLHWLVLMLVVAAYAFILLRENYERGSDIREALKTWHYMLGLAVLALVVLRALVNWSAPAPVIEPPPPAWQHRAARLTHAALYLLMIVLPLLGWLSLSAAGQPVPFFGLTLPALVAPDKALAGQVKEIHEAVATAGYFVIGLHAAAALFHHYVRRDDTLRRMLPGQG